jgi:hypothetical protein
MSKRYPHPKKFPKEGDCLLIARIFKIKGLKDQSPAKEFQQTKF